MEQIKVTVFRPKGRKYFQVQWVDPITGKKKTRSAGTNLKRDAERFAGKLQRQLTEGTYKAPSKVTWADFRQRYTAEHLSSLAIATKKKAIATLNAVERLVDVKRLASLDGNVISQFQQKLRDEGQREPTIKSHLAHLKAALRWAKRVKLLNDVPDITMPSRTATMRGRPITREELERLLLATPKIVAANFLRDQTRIILKIARAAVADRSRMDDLRAELRDCQIRIRETSASWQHIIEGLFLSGLRLAESLHLSWDDESQILVENIDGRRPMVSIPPKLQKRHKFDRTPLVPEFVEFLRKIPPEQRTGFVFNPAVRLSRHTGRLGKQSVGRTISEIGRRANVVVKKDPVEFASAHDLRRSFCDRWANRVMPRVLQSLARHSSVVTTLTFYATHDAELTAEAVWDAMTQPAANTLANTAPVSPDSATSLPSQQKTASL